MKEPNDEDLASHIGPESCEGGSNVALEALTGVRAGWVLSPVMLIKLRAPTRYQMTEGHTVHPAIARDGPALRGRRPHARTDTPHRAGGTALAESTSATEAGRSPVRPRLPRSAS